MTVKDKATPVSREDLKVTYLEPDRVVHQAGPGGLFVTFGIVVLVTMALYANHPDRAPSAERVPLTMEQRR